MNDQDIRTFSINFGPQHPAAHGVLRLVIEVDGGQHSEAERADAIRTRFIEAQGYRVIRFWNTDVLGNLEGVVAEIERVLTTKFGWNAEHGAAAVRVLRGFTRLGVAERAIVAVPDDPDDDCILECAVAAGAHVLVSGDKHLLRLGAFEGVQIVTVAELLVRFAAGPDVSGTN